MRQKLQNRIKCTAALILLCCIWSGLTCATEDETIGSALDALATSDSDAFVPVAEAPERLAEGGNTQAANVMATALYVGDLALSERMLRLAAEQGDAIAAFAFGSMMATSNWR